MSNREKTRVPRTDDKKRRLSTPRHVEIDTTQQTMSDGFQFTSKRKKMDIPSVEDAVVSKKTKKSAADGKKIVKVPEYPATPHDTLMTLKPKDLASQQATAAKIFKTLMNDQVEAVAGVFDGDFTFVAKAVSNVCKKFAKELDGLDLSSATEDVKSISSSSSSSKAAVEPNPANSELESAQQVWQDWLAKAQADVQALTALKTKWSEPLPVGDIDTDVKLNEKDSAFLAASPVGTLLSSIPDAFQVVSIKGDRILRLLSKMSQFSAEQHTFQGAVASKVNQDALAAYKGDAKDTKNIIKQMTKHQ